MKKKIKIIIHFSCLRVLMEEMESSFSHLKVQAGENEMTMRKCQFFFIPPKLQIFIFPKI